MNPAACIGAGFVIGVMIAYSGVGAGALLTPMLVLGGVSAPVAIGSDLLFALVTKIVALVTHVRARTIDGALLRGLAPAGVAGTLVGVALTHQLHVRLGGSHVDHVLRLLLGVALVAAAIAIALRPWLGRRTVSQASTYPVKRLAALGFGVGLVVSMTSIGAGSLTLPLLLLCVPGVVLGRMVGTDIAFAVVLLVPSLLGHAAIGDVDARLSGLLLIGSIPGVIVGTRIHARLPDMAFRMGMAAILTTVGIVMLARPA